MRLDPDGRQIWQYFTDGFYLKSVIEADNGDAVATGAGDGFTVLRLNHEGELVWRRSYGTGYGHAIIELKNGDFMAVGSIHPQANHTVGRTLLINGNGDANWNIVYGSERDTSQLSELRETDEGVVMGGLIYRNEVNGGWIQKINLDGQVIWSHYYFDENQPVKFVDMTSLPGGGFAFCGSANGASLWKIDNDGALVLRQHIPVGRAWVTRGLGMSKVEDRGFVFVGWKVYQGQPNRQFPFATRTDAAGTVLWSKEFVEDVEATTNSLESVIVLPNLAIVAAGSMSNPSNDGNLDAVLVRLDPDIPNPIIFYRTPEDSFLTVLKEDTLQFEVLARAQGGDQFDYQWLRNEATFHVGVNDTFVSVVFDEVKVDTIECRVSLEDYTVSTGWIVSVKDLFIASHSPDTLALALRRGTSQTFSLDSVAVTDGDPVTYQWTLTDLNSFEAEDAGMETGVTIDFLRSGNFQLEGLVYRGEASDNVIWSIAVRSAILDFTPRTLALATSRDSTLQFSLLPFNPESDSLKYNWLLDGIVREIDTLGNFFCTFSQTSQHQVSGILLDGADGDTVAWTVSVRAPDEVRKSESLKVEKLELLSAYPNPFNSTTTIRFTVPSASALASLTLHDLSGRQVRECLSAEVRAGEHSYILNGDDIPAGIYLIRLKTGNFTKVKKVVLVK